MQPNDITQFEGARAETLTLTLEEAHAVLPAIEQAMNMARGQGIPHKANMLESLFRRIAGLQFYTPENEGE